MLALCALALATQAQTQSDGDWRLLRDEDGVRVFERASAKRTVPEVRAEVEIDAPLPVVLAVIADVPGQTKWLDDCIESREVRRESESSTLVYNRTNAPWPVSDRDVVLRTSLEVHGPESALVRFHAVTDPAVPTLAGVVRMSRLDGEFAVDGLAPGRTRVVYRLDIDPGGALPAWIVRHSVTFETLRGLRRVATGAAGKR